METTECNDQPDIQGLLQ